MAHRKTLSELINESVEKLRKKRSRQGGIKGNITFFGEKEFKEEQEERLRKKRKKR